MILTDIYKGLGDFFRWQKTSLPWRAHFGASRLASTPVAEGAATDANGGEKTLHHAAGALGSVPLRMKGEYCVCMCLENAVRILYAWHAFADVATALTILVVVGSPSFSSDSSSSYSSPYCSIA